MGKQSEKGKGQKGKKRPTKVYKIYDTKSGIQRKNQFCPKCGTGVFLAKHKDRVSCGKCGYTEFRKQ